MYEDKKAKQNGAREASLALIHDGLGRSAGSLQPGSSAGRRLLPQPANGELQSARGDTIKPSGAADYGAKY